MNYGQVKAAFLARLGRRDVKPSLVDAWMRETIQRAQRLLRTPAQERIIQYKIGTVFNGLAIPGDFLGLRAILVNGIELVRSDRQTVTCGAAAVGQSAFFCRDGASFLVAPKPAPGSSIRITYLANFDDLVADTDSNFMTEVASDILINGAMKLAKVHFIDPMSEYFENEFVKAIGDLNNMADMDELTNAAITPLYPMNF